MHSNKPSKFLLPIIVFSQFAGTSLWFAGNAIIADIQPATSGLSNITSIVQFGFIAGTLIFSLLTIADRFDASKVFFFSSVIASAANLLLIWLAKDITSLYGLRFVTGFFLAGIYPVGMKIAADWFPEKLGNALGFLVGALVLGTAFPHLLKSQLHNFKWQDVILFTSVLAFAGGLFILLFVPALNKIKTITKPDLSAAFKLFKTKNFRSAAFGYFGHMWEVYAFWAFVPVIIKFFNDANKTNLNVPLCSFMIIGIGSLGCIVGGVLSKKTESKKIAFYSLLISGACCFFSPFIFNVPFILFLFFMLLWGFTVASDSPQFSTLVAHSASLENKGTALTIVTSVGFAITIVSIQLLRSVFDIAKQYGFLLLFIGPVFGLIALKNYSSLKKN